jgi:hypothetical protein
LTAGIYCPVKRYYNYQGSSVTSANTTCANIDAINAQITARIAQFGDGDCRSFDCAFGTGGSNSVTLSSRGAQGDLLSFLLSGANTRTTTLPPGTEYQVIRASVSFTFTIPDSETAVTLSANANFMGVLAQGIATGLTVPKNTITMGTLVFTSRRMLTVDADGVARAEQVVTITMANDKKREFLSARLASVQRRLSQTMDDTEKLHHLREAKDLTAQLAETADRRRLASRNIDAPYTVKIADSSQGSRLLAKIAPGAATSFENSLMSAITTAIANDPTLASGYAVTGVTSKGGAIETVIAGQEGEGSGLATPSTSDAPRNTLGVATFLLCLCQLLLLRDF